MVLLHGGMGVSNVGKNDYPVEDRGLWVLVVGKLDGDHVDGAPELLARVLGEYVDFAQVKCVIACAGINS